MTRILAIDSGSGFSTFDVHRGIVLALIAQGHQVVNYPLSRAMVLAMQYTSLLYRRGYTPKPTPSDVQYIAGVFSLDRALHYDVEWVLVTSGMFFHPDNLVKLKRAGRKIALLCTESPYDSEQEVSRLPFVDVVFTNERTTAREWAEMHPNVHYLPHAYDPALHRPQPPEDEPEVLAHDVVFVGTGWPERIAFLQVVDWTGIDLGLYGTWEKVGSRSKLRPYIANRTIPNAETAALYRRAKIGLNLYRTAVGAESLNPRAYELAACGVFHLSDYRAEVEERFGGLVPTFETPAMLERLIRTWLAHDNERRDFAARLPRAVEGCEFDVRARVVADALERVGAGKELMPV